MNEEQAKELIEVLRSIRNELYLARRVEVIKSKYAAGAITINEFVREISRLA